jgi:hypothetical protein
MTPDDVRQQIELKVVEFLKAGMSKGAITEARAQQISQVVLSLLTPGMTFAQLYKAIAKLDDTVTELAPIVMPFVKDYEEHVNKQALEGVRELIRQGEYDAATKFAKKAINQDVELEWHGSGKP